MLKNLSMFLNLNAFNVQSFDATSENVNDVFVLTAKNWQFGFQTPYSPVMEGIVSFHDDLLIFLTFIVVFVMYILYYIFSTFSVEASKSRAKIKTPEFGGFVHYPMLEIIWTIVPAVILVNLALPSFSLLYSVDEIVEPTFTFKAIGHQWYWSYEILTGNEFAEVLSGDKDTDSLEMNFDSYMLAEEDLKKKYHVRLLAVDNYISLPTQQNIRVLVTAADVIHSWAVPSLGVKLDGCPGRLNQTSLFIERPGFYYGQCSELCGVNHGFMPIGIFAVHVLGTDIPACFADALFTIAARSENA